MFIPVKTSSLRRKKMINLEVEIRSGGKWVGGNGRPDGMLHRTVYIEIKAPSVKKTLYKKDQGYYFQERGINFSYWGEPETFVSFEKMGIDPAIPIEKLQKATDDYVLGLMLPVAEQYAADFVRKIRDQAADGIEYSFVQGWPSLSGHPASL